MLPRCLVALVLEFHKPSCIVLYDNGSFKVLVHWRYRMTRLREILHIKK